MLFCTLGTFYLPAAKRDADKEYLERHIEGAVRFDIDVVADKTTTLPHMLPSAEQFAEQVGKVGGHDPLGFWDTYFFFSKCLLVWLKAS